MKTVYNFEEWKELAKEFDQLKDIHDWKNNRESDYYDHEYVYKLLKLLKEKRKEKNIGEIMHIIQSHAFRNVSGITNPSLYKNSYLGTKKIIEDFQKEVALCFEDISISHFSLTKKIEFFAEIRHSFGRTALLLSGGAIFGMYHLGVIKMLFEQNLLPRIITGSSAGSIVASFICSKKPEELEKIIKTLELDFKAFDKADHTIFGKLKRFFSHKLLLDNKILGNWIRDNVGDYTFLEAYERTGYILNITVTGYGIHEQSRVLNYLTAPNVVIWTASCASCGIPYVYGAFELLCKNEQGEIVPWMPFGRKFVDGSIDCDLPMQKVSELFNVNCYIVSQVNPWVIPFMETVEEGIYAVKFKTKIMNVFKKIRNILLLEWKHRANQIMDLGIIPKEILRYLRLITQTYIGHVTISPKPSLKDYVNILANPGIEDIKRCLPLGEQRAFAKYAYIKALQYWEKTVEKYYYEIRKIAIRIPSNENLLCADEESLELFNVFTPKEKMRKLSLQMNRISSFEFPGKRSKEEIEHMLEKANKKWLIEDN